eukprot:GHRR01025363.1.p1 GENE.GHRR01025363.1~~GHRR01025363.1.p1  ORF type:complete len:100 (-),score=26.57 GHRR01025363.1:79-378(-)
MPGPKVDHILAGLCCCNVVAANRAEAIFATAVALVLRELRGSGEVPSLPGSDIGFSAAGQQYSLLLHTLTVATALQSQRATDALQQAAAHVNEDCAARR